jgi:hypothetical protein
MVVRMLCDEAIVAGPVVQAPQVILVESHDLDSPASTEDLRLALSLADVPDGYWKHQGDAVESFEYLRTALERELGPVASRLMRIEIANPVRKLRGLLRLIGGDTRDFVDLEQRIVKADERTISHWPCYANRLWHAGPEAGNDVRCAIGL